MSTTTTFATLARGAMLWAAVLLSVSGCGARPTRPDSSLYQEVGGEAGIERIVAALVARLYSDARIAFLFEDTDRADLQRLIEEQFCSEFGGPCIYTGRSMADSHSGLRIGHHEFEAFVEDFILAMEEVAVPTRTQNRILAIFAPMRAEVVDR